MAHTTRLSRWWENHLSGGKTSHPTDDNAAHYGGFKLEKCVSPIK